MTTFGKLSTEKVALLLQGLRTIYVADQSKAKAALERELEAELKDRGLVFKAA